MIDRAAFVAAAEEGDRPVVVRVADRLDVETTPMAAFAILSGNSSAESTDAHGGGGADESEDDPTPGSEYAVLLESGSKTASSDPDGAFRAEGAGSDAHARRSFVGYDPAAAVTLGPDGDRVEVFDDRYEELIGDPWGSGGAGGSTDGGADGDGSTADEDAGSDGSGGDSEGGVDVEGDVLDRLRSVLPDVRTANVPPGGPRFDGGLAGFLAYEAVYDLHLAEMGVDRPDSPVPDAGYLLVTRTVAFDHREGTVEFVATPVVGPDDDPGAVYDAVRAERDRVADRLAAADSPDPGNGQGGIDVQDRRADPQETYEAGVEDAREAVLDGEVYQCVLSRRRALDGRVDPLGAYAALREVNPSPYMYCLRFGDLSVVGASPETLVSVRDGEVRANPIAGTCPRGASPVEDRRLAGEMLADDKERAEHTMLVDLARNDVRRVARPGSVRVEEFMTVRKYSHVQHIESTVTADLAPGADAFDATRAAFPAGTLAGAPKVRAMELIDDLEPSPRGVYGGGVGYYDWSGDAAAAIVIRSATVRHGIAGDGGPEGDASPGDRPLDRATVRAGAGIVADSDPAAEYEETERKMKGVLAAVDRLADDAADATDSDESGDPEKPAVDPDDRSGPVDPSGSLDGSRAEGSRRDRSEVDGSRSDDDTDRGDVTTEPAGRGEARR